VVAVLEKNCLQDSDSAIQANARRWKAMNSTDQTRSVLSINEVQAWEQLQRRDPSATFFYAVQTTGVYCRPTCTSRLPLKKNTRFFSSPSQAEAAGFRPCKCCKPTQSKDSRDQAVEKMRLAIESSADQKITLAELGTLVGLSPFSAQRRFKAAMGATPLDYQRALRAKGLRKELRKGNSVTDSIYAAGYNSSSRVYEGAGLGMTPARFAAGGRGEEIRYATGRTSYGWIIVGATTRGLCWLALASTQQASITTLREEFPAATLKSDKSVAQWIEAALNEIAGSKSNSAVPKKNLDLRGTAFQLRVWQALTKIPRSQTLSYSELARQMGIPKSTRAVARACATNRVALLVPCHRIVGATGSLTGYRWGVERKRQLLTAEGAQI
jgi:AraC family transcriptional regulator of adaptative response/methylated-DNA-[protein]-cysteine methyltransferase